MSQGYNRSDNKYSEKMLKKNAIWLFLKFRNNFIYRNKATETFRRMCTLKKDTFFVSFYLHFQCNSVNRIFKLLRSGRNKFKMIKPSIWVFEHHFTESVVFFPPFILFSYSKLQLQRFHVNTGRCLGHRFWAQGSGSISQLFYLADLC